MASVPNSKSSGDSTVKIPSAASFPRLRQIFLCALACLFLPASPAAAEKLPRVESLNFPHRPIRIIVYTSPGGAIDFMARKFAEIAMRYVDQPIVVINRPGAGGIVAFDETLKLPADGYNLLAVTRSNITKMVASNRTDLIGKLDWLAYLMDNPHVVIVNVTTAIDSWKTLLANSEDLDGRQLWLGADIGGVKHASAVRIWQVTGIQARWIPYASGGQAVAALLGGIGAAYLGNPSDAIGKPDLAIAAVAATERLAPFPDAPTFAELGYPGLEGELIWRGFAIKQGTPAPIRDWYATLFRTVANDPDWIAAWQPEGIRTLYHDSETFTAIVQKDAAEFEQLLTEIGLIRKENEFQRIFGLLQVDDFVNGSNLLFIAIFGVGLFVVSRSPTKPHFGEIAVACGGALVACVLLVTSLLLPPANPVDTVGAAGVPRLWSTGLLALAAFQLIIILGSRLPMDPTRSEPRQAEGPRFLFTPFLLSIGLCIILIPFLGYFPTTLLFVPTACWLLGYRKPLAVALLTIGWLAFSYFVFKRLLFVDLPNGWIVDQFFQ